MQVTDYGAWTDAGQRAAMYGMDCFTNLAATALPPAVRYDATDSDYLFPELANRRYRQDGTTLVHGALHLRIPNAFLEAAYGVPDPATMTAKPRGAPTSAGCERSPRPGPAGGAAPRRSGHAPRPPLDPGRPEDGSST